MQKMTLKKTRELDIFYNEHRKNCSNCGVSFKEGDTAHLGYLEGRIPAVLCDKCASLLDETVIRYYWQNLEYEEPSPDNLLWRYMDLAKFISLISRKELFFATASSFEDIFEGAKGVEENKDKWDSFYVDFFKQAVATAPGRDPSNNTEEKLTEEAKRLLDEIEKTGQKTREYTYINCWHLNNYESEAMWKLYSKDYANAIAIQTTTKSIYEAIDKDPYISIGKVKYIDYKKTFASINGAFWYKRKSFEYENEVRLITTKINSSNKGIYIPVNIDKLIEKIYVSPYASEWFYDVVNSVVKKYGVKAAVTRSTMKEKPFY